MARIAEDNPVRVIDTVDELDLDTWGFSTRTAAIGIWEPLRGAFGPCTSRLIHPI
jgi:hypothetical protein